MSRKWNKEPFNFLYFVNSDEKRENLIIEMIQQKKTI